MDNDESALSSAHEDEGNVKLESESESDTRAVSDNEPDEQPPPNPLEDITESDPDEGLAEEHFWPKGGWVSALLRDLWWIGR